MVEQPVEEKTQGAGEANLLWDLSRLYESPKIYPAPAFEGEESTRAGFLQGLPFEEAETRVFACWGVPETEDEEKVPGVVLVHGGGGTAFRQWVRIWNNRGYAAISVDLEGHQPAKNPETGTWAEHKWSGPARQGIFEDIDRPIKDQWFYHAVADVVLANSFLRSLNGVDPDRVGITGISWGGILTSTVVGVDDRFVFAVPVYGSGFLYVIDNHYGQTYDGWNVETQRKYRESYDASAYLPAAGLPMLWVNSDRDFHFPLVAFTRSYELVEAGSVLSIHPGMDHGHFPGWSPREIYEFADSVVKQGRNFPEIAAQRYDPGRRRMHIDYRSDEAITAAKLIYSTLEADSLLQPVKEEPFQWTVIDLPVSGNKEEIVVQVPGDEVTAFYVNLTNSRAITVSTKLIRSRSQ